MNPRFSIIVPLYNKAPYVRKALESIVAQTYKDWDSIIIDDGSTDGSADVVRDFIRAVNGVNGENGENGASQIDDRLTIICQANAGVAAARNNGVKASKGEYVCFLDADDWWEVNFLEKMDKLIKDYPDAGLYATNFVYYKPGKTRIEHQNVRTGYINYPEIYYRTGSMPVWTGAACMPRKVFDEMGGFPVGIKLGEDFLLWAKTAVHYNVAYCEKPLAYYNNDVPASLRATRNLHEPRYHMLFNMQPIEAEIEKALKIEDRRLKNDACAEEWKALLDWLRMNGLMEYWMSEKYHEDAAKELKKVDWSKQSKRVVQLYNTPVWWLNVIRTIKQLGSICKHRIIRLLYKIKSR